MGSEWRKVKLEQIAIFKNGKKIDENERKANGRYYIYGSNGIIGKTDKFLVGNDCIIIGRVGAYCGSLQYSKGPSWVTDNAIFCLTNKGTDLKFLFYVLKTIPIRDMAGGSAQPLINQEILNNITITCPPLPEQQKIAFILSAFDDKIELKNEMNKTLEEIAQAIFKHWFIDFEFPNENGEPYKSSGGEFVDSELGPIPKGWKVSNIYENIERVSIKNKEDKNYIVLTVTKEGKFVKSDEYFSKQVYSKKLTNYKIIKRSYIGYNPARANIGSIAMLTEYDVRVAP